MSYFEIFDVTVETSLQNESSTGSTPRTPFSDLTNGLYSI